jgi:hypothetical protein
MAKKTKTNQKAMNIDCAIDLGTENVVVAGKHPVFNTVTCVPMLDGGYDFPAAVYMESENHCAIGRVAKDNSFLEKDKVATHFKDKLGTSEMIDVNYHSFSPEQLTALVLKEAVISAEQELGKTVRNVILTVPAGFSTHARAALIRAANMTGVNVVALVDEPIAAAISYLKSKEAADKVKGKILILDMGAGTTDFFVFDYQDQKITPIMKDGIVNQGGNDYTEALTSRIKEKTNWKVSGDKQSRQEEQILKNKAEEIKQHLSKLKCDQTVVTQGGRPAVVRVTRDEFEKCTVLLQNELEKKMNEILDKLRNLGIDGIDVVVLTGGASHMPQVKRLARKIFPETTKIEEHDHDCAVVKGAVLYSQSPEKYSIIGKAYGMRVLTPAGEPKVNNIILASDICPVSRKRIYKTIKDNQERVTLKLYESHAVKPYMNESDGTFLEDIVLLLPPGLKNGCEIEVEFQLDKSGILSVNAKEKKSGRSVTASFQSEGIVNYKPVEKQKKEIVTFLKSMEK